jgi:hypothetical protein
MPRFYVTMTWDDFPEGGSYGAVVTADDTTQAEAAVREQMAATRSELYDEDLDPEDQDAVDAETARIVAEYANSWHVVDCFDLDAFIEAHVDAEESAKWAPLFKSSRSPDGNPS